jgi:hypothetical protein
MQDIVKFNYAEAQVEIICVLCNTIFNEFPDSDKPTFQCPGCQSPFKLTYKIERLNRKRETSKKIAKVTGISKN